MSGRGGRRERRAPGSHCGDAGHYHQCPWSRLTVQPGVNMANLRILKPFAAVTLACLLVFSYAPARAAGVTAIRCGQLLNPADGSITRNAVIVVNGERVERVGANAEIPAGARVIDLSAYTVMPGLI